MIIVPKSTKSQIKSFSVPDDTALSQVCKYLQYITGNRCILLPNFEPCADATVSVYKLAHGKQELRIMVLEFEKTKRKSGFWTRIFRWGR